MVRTQSGWFVKARYDDQDKGECSWILWLDKADKEVKPDEVKLKVQSALARAREAKFIGVLTSVNRDAFGLVCGRSRQNLWDIEANSETSISVPRPNSSEKEIVIKGM